MFGRKMKASFHQAPPPNAPDERSVSKGLVMLSVFYIIAGIMMLAWPHLTIEMMGKAMGICLLVMGMANIIIYLTKDHLETILQMDLTEGIIFTAFGAFMLMHADFVSMALPFGVGILLLIGGVSHIQYALDMKKLKFIRWYIMLFFAIVLIFLGMILIYNPFQETFLIYFVAISLLLNGVMTITSILTISHRLKAIMRGKFTPKPVTPPEEIVVREENLPADSK